MFGIPGLLGTLIDLALVILGFGFIIFLHELGHFLAARWAGIRVLAFAVGFGKPLLVYRRGLGWSGASTEGLYQQRLREEGRARTHGQMSPTEYRLNLLPLGGYVKMLGQEDLDPTAVSAEPDSYQTTPAWKRMIVISAGVIMNLVSAAILFIVVFMAGLRTEPAVVGAALPGSPAASAVALNAAELGVAEPGLMTGDRIVTINGRRPNSFNDLVLATAMAGPGQPVNLTVERPGLADPLRWSITPRKSEGSGLLEMGIEPSRDSRLLSAGSPEAAVQFTELMRRLGVPGVEPGMTLVRVGNLAAEGQGSGVGAPAVVGVSPHELEAAARASGGAAVPVAFRSQDGREITGAITPRPALQSAKIVLPDRVVPISHLLGLIPVMTVADATEAGRSKGLHDGDIFVRLGNAEYPGVAEGVAEIRRWSGRVIPVVVARRAGGEEGSGEGPRERVELAGVRVGSDGRIGFGVGDTGSWSTMLALPPGSIVERGGPAAGRSPPALGVIDTPGARVVTIDGRAVENFAQMREALRAATAGALRDLPAPWAGGASVGGLAGASAETSPAIKVPLELESAPPPTWRGLGPMRKRAELSLTPGDVRALHALAWTSPLTAELFEPAQFILRAAGPIGAVRMGLAETHRVMLSTYVTLVRLFQGTVKVEQLRGPVGIADLGTRVAGRGFIWLLFFMALVSVNLAVMNFLPLPIVDGGQFIFLVIEQIRGRPVPVEVQNIATIAGLVLLGSVFLVVTLNDVTRLIWG